MKPPYRIRALSGILFAAFVAALHPILCQAVSFDGTMLFTITQTMSHTMNPDGSVTLSDTVPGLPVGTTFNGAYAYDNAVDDPNGVFTSHDSLSGVINLPAVFNQTLDLGSYTWFATLTVSNGSVVSLDYSASSNGLDSTFNATSFSFGSYVSGIGARGTVAWTQPSAQLDNRISVLDAPTSTVPDGAQSVWLVAFGLGALAAMRQRLSISPLV